MTRKNEKQRPYSRHFAYFPLWMIPIPMYLHVVMVILLCNPWHVKLCHIKQARHPTSSGHTFRYPPLFPFTANTYHLYKLISSNGQKESREQEEQRSSIRSSYRSRGKKNATFIALGQCAACSCLPANILALTHHAVHLMYNRKQIIDLWSWKMIQRDGSHSN